jgi:predicted  nucleic acid-binding Zn-ribbon protein
VATEPDHLVLSLLREMRASIEDVRVDVKDVRERVGDLGEKTEVWQRTIASAAGFAVHANSRNDKLEKELAALKKRGEKLEKAR